MKNIENLYTCDVCMSKEPMFIYTFQFYRWGAGKSIEAFIPVMYVFINEGF